MFDKDNEAPPPPDYSPVVALQKQIADEALKLSREQFEWAKQAYAEDKQITDKVVEAFLDAQERNKQWAIADRQRYEEIFQPLEDDLAAEARAYATPERRDMEMGRAQAEVGQQFQAAREAAQRNLESYGINPASTRYAALDLGMRAQEAAAKAAAGNQAARAVEDTARALRTEAINIGRGYPGQINAAQGVAQNAGAGAVNSSLAATASGANTMGTGAQWSGIAGNAASNWANTLNMSYGNQMQAHKANQEASSGWGSLLGLGAGLASKAFLGPSMPWIFAEEGGAIPEPVVPENASPSRGAIPDDVPARVSAGEFVVPKDVVEWHGQKAFYQLIERAQKERAQAQQRTGAIPDERMAPPAPPAYVSPSARRGALPVG